MIELAQVILTHGGAQVLAELLTSPHARLTDVQADTIRDLLIQYNAIEESNNAAFRRQMAAEIAQLELGLTSD